MPDLQTPVVCVHTAHPLSPPQVVHVVDGWKLWHIGLTGFIDSTGYRDSTNYQANGSVRCAAMIAPGGHAVAVGVDGIYTYNTSTWLWDQRRGYGGSAIDKRNALFVVHRAADSYAPRLYTAAWDWFFYSSDDGLNWSGIYLAPNSMHAYGSSSLFHKGQIWVLHAPSYNRLQVRSFDPETNTVTAYDYINGGGGYDWGGQLFEYGDRLFLFARRGVTDGTLVNSVYEFLAGSWSLVHTLSTVWCSATTWIGHPGHLGKHTQFTDPDTGDIVWILPGRLSAGGSDGACAVRLTPSGSGFSETNITTSVIPAGLRPGGGSLYSGNNHSWDSYVDHVTSPASPTVHLYYGSHSLHDSFNTYYYGAWNGVGALIANPLGILTPCGFYFPHYLIHFPKTKKGGLPAFHTSRLAIDIKRIQSFAGYEEITFTPGPPFEVTTPTGRTCQFFWQVEGDEQWRRCTLIAGTVSGGTGTPTNDTVAVHGITADGVAHTVRWNRPLDNVPLGRWPTVEAYLF